MDVSLRKSVDFRPSGDGIALDHSIWRINISHKLIEGSSAKALFSGKAKVPFDPQDSLMALLRGQGCLSVPEKDKYSGEDVFEIFNGVSLDWYREYYQHELWDNLRNGKASVNGLVTWLLHNYHVSVNAGITHARISTVSTNPILAKEHKECALEEYWHANSFYFIENEAIKITKDEVKAYIPLASSYAFQLHLRYLSEHDPLGYILVSYFQERTIMFHEGCEVFYSAVETHYNMFGLFDGWRKHISLDIELDHRNKRSSILTSGEIVTAEMLSYSVNNARKAAQLLLLCLDDIVEFSTETDSGVSLRLVHETSRADPKITCLSSNISKAFLSSEAEFRAHLVELIEGLYGDIIFAEADLEWVETAIHQSLFNYLGCAYYHDDIMVAGDLARVFKYYPNDIPVSLAMEAIRNHLLELSNNLHTEFLASIAFLTAFLLNKFPAEYRFEKALNISIARLYEVSSAQYGFNDKISSTIVLVSECLASSILNIKPDIINPNSA